MNIRVARLKNGDEYIINRIDFRTDIVYTYGEVLKYLYRGDIIKKIYYKEGVVKFPKSEVEIYEIPKYTRPFLEKLLRQSERNVKPAPKVEVSTETLNFINKTINNLNDITFSEFFKPRPSVKREFPGKITNEILEKIIENGYTTVIYRSDPENNFIADSYVLAIDEKSAREKGVNYDRPITEIGRVYYDEENDIYYRNTGSAD
jgi:hypothetical protein